MVKRLAAIALLAASAGAGASTNSEIHYAALPETVLPPPAPSETATPAEAPFRFVYLDNQMRIDQAGIETYSAYRVAIRKPEALQMGNIALSWNPDTARATVHHVRIIRQDQVIDVLEGSRFQIIQREGALEQSVLTGDLTAALQVPGLRVGDDLEVATSFRTRDPTFGDHAFGLYQFPVQGLPGSFRFKLSWPEKKSMRFQTSRDLAGVVPRSDGGEQTVSYELRDPRGVIINDGAPVRFNIRRLVEFSDFKDWAELSQLEWPLYAAASEVAADSPLRGEAARIAADASTPLERAQAALRLVQDEIRYVYVGLDGGNYQPASADETWRRRFGDCKAKTAVLLALLRQLGIKAEAVLVTAGGGDGLDARLPAPSIFDHVLVRARIGDRSYWLDGTRLGDRYLDLLPEPSFSWALPLRKEGADLEPVKALPFARPQFIGVLDVDASAGFDEPAKIALQYVYRGDEAYNLRTGLVSLSPEDAGRALRSYWGREEGWVDADDVAWRYDERRRTLVLSLSGTGKPDWTGDDEDGHDHTIWRGGFYPPDELRRPREQDESAPWLKDFPSFKCWAVTIRLPQPGAKHKWSYNAEAMNRLIAGTRYWRIAAMRGEVLRLVKSVSVEVPEISAAEARIQNDAIKGFNNRMSSVFEVATDSSGVSAEGREELPFGDDIHWVTDDSPCVAQPES